jgi:hypothetical protein
MMVELRQVESLCDEGQRIRPEREQCAGERKGVEPRRCRPVQVVDAAHLLDHGPVEGCVVRDERVLADEGHHLRVELLPARSIRDRGRGDAVDAHVPGRELVMALRGNDERGHLLDDLAVTDSREADGAERGTRGVRCLDVDGGEVESTGRSGGHGAEPRIRCRHSTVGLTVLAPAPSMAESAGAGHGGWALPSAGGSPCCQKSTCIMGILYVGLARTPG